VIISTMNDLTGAEVTDVIGEVFGLTTPSWPFASTPPRSAPAGRRFVLMAPR
jgi:hypothetical protein